MLLLEFCSLSHHHLAKAHVLFLKAHSSDPFSLKPSLDLPALPPPTTTTPWCLGEVSYPFPWFPSHVNIPPWWYLLLYTLVFQQSASQAQLWASKAENMSDSSFMGPREHLSHLAPNTQKCWTSLEFKILAPQKNLEQGNKIHSFSCCVSRYTRSLLLKSYFTMDTCSLFHKVQKRKKGMFSIKLHAASFDAYSRSRIKYTVFYKSYDSQTFSLMILLLICVIIQGAMKSPRYIHWRWGLEWWNVTFSTCGHRPSLGFWKLISYYQTSFLQRTLSEALAFGDEYRASMVVTMVRACFWCLVGGRQECQILCNAWLVMQTTYWISFHQCQ